jgi:hypothetical protein
MADGNGMKSRAAMSSGSNYNFSGTKSGEGNWNTGGAKTGFGSIAGGISRPQPVSSNPMQGPGGSKGPISGLPVRSVPPNVVPTSGPPPGVPAVQSMTPWPGQSVTPTFNMYPERRTVTPYSFVNGPWRNIFRNPPVFKTPEQGGFSVRPAPAPPARQGRWYDSFIN